MSNSTNGDAIRASLSDSYEKTPGYFIWDVSEAVGQQLDNMATSVAEIENEIDVNNLTGDDLTKFVLQRKGVERKTATYAITTLAITGTGDIAAGDLFETENGVQFAADAATSITDSGSIAVTAVIAGNTGMVGANTITDMPVTIPGIVTCTNADATTGGYDEEDDDSLRSRYLAKLQDPLTSSNKNAYKEWALDVSGVGGAKVYAAEDSLEGDYCVDVVIIDSNMTVPDSALVASVQAYIDPGHTGKGDGAAPIGAHCYVSAATALNIDISAKIKLSGGSTQEVVDAELRLAIRAYLKSIAFISSSVSYGKIGNCIIDSDGVQDYENLLVNSATANVDIPSRHVAVIGTVTFTYE